MTAEPLAALDRLVDGVLLAESGGGITSAALDGLVGRRVEEVCHRIGQQVGEAYAVCAEVGLDMSMTTVMALVGAAVGPALSTELTATAALVQLLAHRVAELTGTDLATLLRDATDPAREVFRHE